MVPLSFCSGQIGEFKTRGVQVQLLRGPKTARPLRGAQNKLQQMEQIVAETRIYDCVFVYTIQRKVKRSLKL